MSDNGSVTANRDGRLAEVLDAYLEALKTGVAPDADELLARYPDLAEDLKECLASLAFIRQAEVSANRRAGDGEEMPVADDHAGTLGDFRILREVGRDGMGIVSEAEQLSLKRRVALKVLPFAATMDPRHLQRFHDEAQAAACLHHTNIVPVFFVGSERGVHFYAMQFIDGQPLSDVIHQLLRQIAWEEPSRPRRLERDIPAELEIIVLKAMEKRPQDRYATAQELADELRCFLDHRPIHARLPSLAQRAMKWTRRHRGVARAVFVCLSAALVVEAISTTLIWQEKERTRAALQTADRNRDEAEQQRREAIENLKDAQDAVEKLLQVGRDRLAEVLNMEPTRAELAAEGLQFYREFLQKKNRSPEIRLLVARAYINVGVIQRQLGNVREGNQNIKEGVDLASELLAARPECLDALAVGWNDLAGEKLDTNQVVEAQEAFEKARDIETRLVSDHPDRRIYQEHLARVCNNLGSVHARQGQREAAERCFR